MVSPPILDTCTTTERLPLGKVDKLDLLTFYPVFAGLGATIHTSGRKRPHPAELYRIYNDISPEIPPARLLNGRWGKLVLVDDRVPKPSGSADLAQWCPRTSARNLNAVGKLRGRLYHHGYVLQAAAAVAGAILSEVYTTSPVSTSSQRRMQLRYRGSPISDFGICRGSVKVLAHENLAFFSMKDHNFIEGQDADDHYWLYFTSIKGREFYLDFGTFFLGFMQVVMTRGYLPVDLEVRFDRAPCRWTDPDTSSENPYTERGRLSILRSPTLQEIMKCPFARRSQKDIGVFCKLLETFSQQNIEEEEQQLFSALLYQNCKNLAEALQAKVWKRLPRDPTLLYQMDCRDDRLI